jgi:hypothetical protein
MSRPNAPKLIKSQAETWKEYWDRKKGTIAIIGIATTVALWKLNGHNLKVCRQFIEEKNLTEEFENWLTPFITKY